jgi:hypothetical protein
MIRITRSHRFGWHIYTGTSRVWVGFLSPKDAGARSVIMWERRPGILVTNIVYFFGICFIWCSRLDLKRPLPPIAWPSAPLELCKTKDGQFIVGRN